MSHYFHPPGPWTGEFRTNTAIIGQILVLQSKFKVARRFVCTVPLHVYVLEFSLDQLELHVRGQPVRVVGHVAEPGGGGRTFRGLLLPSQGCS